MRAGMGRCTEPEAQRLRHAPEFAPHGDLCPAYRDRFARLALHQCDQLRWPLSANGTANRTLRFHPSDRRNFARDPAPDIRNAWSDPDSRNRAPNAI
jgi:hypothetical protein